jgi:hypothetical protein
MMAVPMDQAMLNAVSDTFENLAFMEALPADDQTSQAKGDLWETALLIHEPIQGEIRSVLPRQLLSLVAATVFGLQAEDCDDTTLQDVSAEVLNTIAGRFLFELLPEQGFRIGLPEVNPLEMAEDIEGIQHWLFQANGCPFAVWLNILPCDMPIDRQFSVDKCPTC